MAELSFEETKNWFEKKDWEIKDTYNVDDRWSITARVNDEIRISVDPYTENLNNVFIELPVDVEVDKDTYIQLQSLIDSPEFRLSVISEGGVFNKAKEQTEKTDAELIERLEKKNVGYTVTVTGCFQIQTFDTLKNKCMQTISELQSLNLS